VDHDPKESSPPFSDQKHSNIVKMVETLTLES
jgi:hypothetical protein